MESFMVYFIEIVRNKKEENPHYCYTRMFLDIFNKFPYHQACTSTIWLWKACHGKDRSSLPKHYSIFPWCLFKDIRCIWVNKTGSEKCVGRGRNSPRSYCEVMPTTLMYATQIHSGDTRTYVSVGELATLTMPMGTAEKKMLSFPVTKVTWVNISRETIPN